MGLGGARRTLQGASPAPTDSLICQRMSVSLHIQTNKARDDFFESVGNQVAL